MISIPRALTGVLAVVLTTAILIMPSAGQGEKEKVGLRLDWVVYGTHAPFFLAMEKGYYAAENIDIKISEGQGSATVVKLIAQGIDQYGFLDFGTMAKGVVQGMPVRAIFGVNQTSPMTVISRAEAPIKSPQELVGKLIAMAPAEATAQVFPALLAAAKVEPNSVNVVNPAVGAKNALLLQKRVDAITGYLNVEVPRVEAQGAKIYYFKFADFGVNTLSNGIVGNAEFIAKNPSLTKRFLSATTRGWNDARKDPAAAVEAIFKTYPQYRDHQAGLVRELELSFSTLETPNTKGKPLGWMSREDWQQTQQILSKYAGLQREVDVSQYFSNEYIP